MVMMSFGDFSLLTAYKWVYGSRLLAWSKGRQPPGAMLHSSHELGELLQCFKQARIQRGLNLPPQKSLHKNFWVYLFAATLDMCSIRMLL